MSLYVRVYEGYECSEVNFMHSSGLRFMLGCLGMLFVKKPQLFFKILKCISCLGLRHNCKIIELNLMLFLSFKRLFGH